MATQKTVGLKSIVREELKLRGLSWTKKAKQAVPNRKASKKLEARRKAHAADPMKPHQRKAPGSYNLKKG